ncbi:hypothetical protein KI387_039661, partial [Taxus chinensis]
AVELDGDDQMVFVVAPDIVCFHRIKVKDFLPLEMEERFDNGHEINLEDWLWHLRDDLGLDKIRCFVLPSLIEGCILGLSKFPPQNKDFQESKQLWLHKNGLEFPKDCFYIKVQFTSDEDIYKSWFPSSLVLKGSGLMPVAYTLRASKVVHALDNFRKCIADWDFFDGGTPKFQEGTHQFNSSLEDCTWVTAKDILQPRCFSENHKDEKCALDDCTMCSSTVVISSLDFRRSKLSLATIESRREDVHNLSQRNENQICICPTPRTITKNIAKIVPHFITRRIVPGQNGSLAQKTEPSTNKTQGYDGLTKEFAAISNKEVESNKFISPEIPTQGRQYILKAPSFARRKPSAVKSETKNTSSGSKSKDEIGGSKTATTTIQNEIGGSTTATTRIQNGVKISKKNLSETDMKAILVCLKKLPNKETEGSSSGSKKVSKKRGSVSSTGGHQALNSTRNPQEKAKPCGHRPKKPQASSGSSTYELQHSEIASSDNLFQNVVTAGNTLHESFNEHSPALVTEKESKRKELSGTKEGFHMSELNTNKDELERQTKKAKPDQEVASIVQDESNRADVIHNAVSEVIPDGKIKPNNAKKRNNSALDPIAIVEKVRDCHSKDNLKSLTVPELKCFLSAKKARVGGKKEELIQRI